MTDNSAKFSVDEVIEMAWADDVSFEKIRGETHLTEAEVIDLMRSNLKWRSFKRWRQRVTGRLRKHEKRSRLFKILDDE